MSEVKDFNELVKFLGELAKLENAEILTTANANMASSLVNDIETCFEKEQDNEGNKWAERKDKTNKNNLLQDTGDLNNFDFKADAKEFFVFNNRGVAGKDNFHYGLSHQFGAFKNGKQIIPKRPFIPLKGDNIENSQISEHGQSVIKKQLEETIRNHLKLPKK